VIGGGTRLLAVRMTGGRVHPGPFPERPIEHRNGERGRRRTVPVLPGAPKSLPSDVLCAGG
jgi:hypothetical protein